LKRGSIVSAIAPGDYGKPRPALIVQSDRLTLLSSIVVCLLTSDVDDENWLRVIVDPSPSNGLRRRSQIMVDKVVTLDRSRLGDFIGMVDELVLEKVEERLAVLVGLAD
jgi:mRNA interferase MazF